VVGIQRILSLGEFLKSKIFKVPSYQRNYAWENKHLRDLWNDLYYISDDKKHFFGTIIVKESEKNKNWTND